MNRHFKRHFAVGCLLAAGWVRSRPLNGETLGQMPRFTVQLYNYAQVSPGTLAQAKAAASVVFRRAKPVVSVLVYNYAAVPDSTLDSSENQASNIFDQAGIVLRWTHCPTSENEIENLQSCAQHADPQTLFLRILPQSMAEQLRRSPDKFGLALEFHAFVFHHRVRQWAEDGHFPESVILAAVIAHELGHLLLAEQSHFPTGIMRATLAETDFKLARKGWLTFTPQQAQRIRDRQREQLSASR